MSRSIGEPLADDTTDRAVGTFNIINAESDTVVVAEIEFREVAVKVFFAYVLIGPVNAAFED